MNTRRSSWNYRQYAKLCDSVHVLKKKRLINTCFVLGTSQWRRRNERPSLRNNDAVWLLLAERL